MFLAPPRTLGFASLVGITFFCVAGGAYGLEDAVGAAGPAWALLSVPPVSLCVLSMVLCPRPTQILGIAGVVAGWLAYWMVASRAGA